MDKISLPVLLFFITVALTYFPGGALTMAASCREKEIDHWDWLFSLTVPFYGLAEAFSC